MDHVGRSIQNCLVPHLPLMLPPGITLLAPVPPQHADILSPEALKFLATLQRYPLLM